MVRANNIQSFRYKARPLRPRKRPPRSISRTFYANNRWLRRPGPWPGARAVTGPGESCSGRSCPCRAASDLRRLLTSTSDSTRPGRSDLIVLLRPGRAAAGGLPMSTDEGHTTSLSRRRSANPAWQGVSLTQIRCGTALVRTLTRCDL